MDRKFLSIGEKEQLIVSNIVNCNNEIKTLLTKTNISKLFNINDLLTRTNIYEFNMLSLAKDMNPLFESESADRINATLTSTANIKNTRGNYYSYFQKVENFINVFEPNLIHSLNEDMKPLHTSFGATAGGEVDFRTFKDDLRLLINNLEKQNDFVYTPNDIIKIKRFANKPILVHGFNITNNNMLIGDLCKQLNVPKQKFLEGLNGICFNKSEKQLMYVFDDLSNTICYDLASDTLDLFNIIVKNDKEERLDLLPHQKVTAKNYLQSMREVLHNNIIELWSNVAKLGLNFSDNLYCDRESTMKAQDYIKKQEYSFIKK